ncbi:MAG: Cys-tRNA(Pro) deacylase [Bifidobacteriaceae bacterium]|nr:Cys-tRNA(Pro) deacylase [Bifidobacteriaceae bacterium]
MPTKATVGTPAILALRRLGVPYAVHVYKHNPRDDLGFGLEAARATKFDPKRVFKTLMAAVDGRLCVAVVPVAGSLDLRALAQAFRSKRAVMATVAVAERATGYVVGGISPIAQRQSHPTVIDIHAQEFPTILVSGGARGVDLELAPNDLAAVTQASFAPVARMDAPL